MTEEYRESMIRRIDTCPFNQANGFKASLPEEGFAIVEAEIRPEHKNIWGLPHGGILFALADVAAGLAAHSVCEGHIVTSGSSVNFIYASESAVRIRAEGRIIKKGHALAVVQTEVYDEEGHHLLTGQFNMFHG